MRRLLAPFFMAALLAASAEAELVLLRVSLQDSLGNPLNQSLIEFKSEVEKRTKGAVTVTIYDQSQFYNDYQVPKAVGSGAIEMGLAPLGQYAGEIPSPASFCSRSCSISTKSSAPLRSLAARSEPLSTTRFSPTVERACSGGSTIDRRSCCQKTSRRPSMAQSAEGCTSHKEPECFFWGNTSRWPILYLMGIRCKCRWR